MPFFLHAGASFKQNGIIQGLLEWVFLLTDCHHMSDFVSLTHWQKIEILTGAFLFAMTILKVKHPSLLDVMYFSYTLDNV